MSTPPVEKLRRKGCCGDGRRESHGGGDDGARGGCGDGGCHTGAGAGWRRVRVAPEGLWWAALRGAGLRFEVPGCASRAAEAPGWFTSVIGGEVLHLTSESLDRPAPAPRGAGAGTAGHG